MRRVVRCATTCPAGTISTGIRMRGRRSGRAGHSVEAELVALDVLHHEARLVVAIGKQ